MTPASSIEVPGTLWTPIVDDASTVAVQADGCASLPSLAGYHVVRDDAPLPAIDAGHLYNYLLAGNGVFLQAQRPGLSVLLRIAPALVRGLPVLRSRLRVRFPRVPKPIVREMLSVAAEAARDPNGGLEVLLYLTLHAGRWQLLQPTQEQTHSSVQLARDADRAAVMDALIDVHSHPFAMRGFSGTDNQSDGGAFRFAVLIADPAGAPSLHARLCVYGAFLEVPPALLFELPEDLAGVPS